MISVLRPHDDFSYLASHCCSQCGKHLFDAELKPGEKVIATDNISSADGKHLIPKGRVVRITGFVELSPSVQGFAFCGLLAAGAFHPERFAAVWNLERILDYCEPV